MGNRGRAWGVGYVGCHPVRRRLVLSVRVFPDGVGALE